jgi:hypothetical protein
VAAPDVVFHKRCGWLDNPTPANFSLIDHDGEWILESQGHPGVPGFDDYLPDFDDSQKVKTNMDYGYGCACLNLKVDAAKGDVLAMGKGSEILPLKRCRADKSLPKAPE